MFAGGKVNDPVDGALHPFGGAAAPQGAAYWTGGKIVPFNEL